MVPELDRVVEIVRFCPPLDQEAPACTVRPRRLMGAVWTGWFPVTGTDAESYCPGTTPVAQLEARLAFVLVAPVQDTAPKFQLVLSPVSSMESVAEMPAAPATQWDTRTPLTDWAAELFRVKVAAVLDDTVIILTPVPPIRVKVPEIPKIRPAVKVRTDAVSVSVRLLKFVFWVPPIRWVVPIPVNRMVEFAFKNPATPTLFVQFPAIWWMFAPAVQAPAEIVRLPPIVQAPLEVTAPAITTLLKVYAPVVPPVKRRVPPLWLKVVIVRFPPTVVWMEVALSLKVPVPPTAAKV